MKNTDFMLAEKMKEIFVEMAINDKFPLDINELDVSGVLEKAQKRLKKDELYVRNAKLEALKEFVFVEDIDELMNALDILEAHPDKTDITSWVDGITMVERYETSFTVRDLLEEITPVGVTI